jgi:hypothetical protein
MQKILLKKVRTCLELIKINCYQRVGDIIFSLINLTFESKKSNTSCNYVSLRLFAHPIKFE